MVRSEAAGVIAQITSPTLEHYQHINGFIENMEDLIRSLTCKLPCKHLTHLTNSWKSPENHLTNTFITHLTKLVNPLTSTCHSDNYMLIISMDILSFSFTVSDSPSPHKFPICHPLHKHLFVISHKLIRVFVSKVCIYDYRTYSSLSSLNVFLHCLQHCNLQACALLFKCHAAIFSAVWFI